MISVTKLRNGVCFEMDNTPYKVSEYQHKHLSRGSGTIKIKAVDLNDGRTVAKTFKSGDKVEEIDVVKKKMQYLYNEDDSLVFMNEKTFEQIEVKKQVIGDQVVFLKDGESYDLLAWGEKILGINLAPKVVMEVVEAAPGEKGDSASNIYKDAVMEGGVKIRVPLFVNAGEKIRVDTRSLEYVERA